MKKAKQNNYQIIITITTILAKQKKDKTILSCHENYSSRSKGNRDKKTSERLTPSNQTVKKKITQQSSHEHLFSAKILCKLIYIHVMKKEKIKNGKNKVVVYNFVSPSQILMQSYSSM